jgi:hypothetical protein
LLTAGGAHGQLGLPQRTATSSAFKMLPQELQAVELTPNRLNVQRQFLTNKVMKDLSKSFYDTVQKSV